MNEDIEQFLYGTLLGDSYISKCYDKRVDKYRHEFRVEHSTKQEKYALWKRDILEPLGVLKPIYRKRESSIKGRLIKSHSITIISCGNKLWRPYREIFYTEDGIKVVTDEILSILTPKAIAIWYMDDGNYHQFRNVAALNTQSFTLGEHHLMVENIQRITGARANIAAVKPSGQYYLYFPRDETRKLLHSIEQYIPQSTGMRYKSPIGWDKAVRLPPNYRQCMPSRIPEADGRKLIINNLNSFAESNDLSDGFPVVLYCYTRESYSFKAIQRLFGSFSAALSAAGLPMNFI